MAAKSVLIDSATGTKSRIVGGGALAVSSPYPSESFNATLGTDDTAVNIITAKADNIFCITGLILVGNKNISATVDATVNIYTAAASDTALSGATRILFTLPVARSGSIILSPILVDTEIAEYINGETTDDDVLVTILGYYLKNQD
jgi:hypothetical protein